MYRERGIFHGTDPSFGAAAGGVSVADRQHRQRRDRAAERHLPDFEQAEYCTERDEYRAFGKRANFFVFHDITLPLSNIEKSSERQPPELEHFYVNAKKASIIPTTALSVQVHRVRSAHRPSQRFRTPLLLEHFLLTSIIQFRSAVNCHNA